MKVRAGSASSGDADQVLPEQDRQTERPGIGERHRPDDDQCCDDAPGDQQHHQEDQRESCCGRDDQVCSRGILDVPVSSRGAAQIDPRSSERRALQRFFGGGQIGLVLLDPFGVSASPSWKTMYRADLPSGDMKYLRSI